jgi:hypothetical protein
MHLLGDSMGEAKRRGSFEDRRSEAHRALNDMSKELGGGGDPVLEGRIQAGIQLFLNEMPASEWTARRRAIVTALVEKTAIQTNGRAGLAEAASLRIREDEIAWYLYLCELAVDAPLCIETSQAQRSVPFIASIGAKAHLVPKVAGFQRKISELLTVYKSNPDGLIFELLVALGYAEKGWDVEFIPESRDSKSPDFIARRPGREVFVECKRLARTTEYSESERTTFLKLWDMATSELLKNKQWIWMHATFHVEVQTLPKEFLVDLLRSNLPLRTPEAILRDDEFATIKARLMNRPAIRDHLKNFMVKDHSPMLNSLMGGDWAPDNSSVTAYYAAHHQIARTCEVPALGRYVDDLGFACGITRVFDSPESIDKKAKDITKLLSKAVDQVPRHGQSIIHIACETMEGAAVEERRTEKVRLNIPQFMSDKPVAEVRFHRIHAHSRPDMLFEIDERVDRFRTDWAVIDRNIPEQVCVGVEPDAIDGNPWD